MVRSAFAIPAILNCHFIRVLKVSSSDSHNIDAINWNWWNVVSVCWNEQVGAYVLNFSGRVTMASVKNFQLVDPDEQNAVILQFGRVGKDQFTMDMQWPMSPFQAFAITMSSFDSKIACD